MSLVNTVVSASGMYLDTAIGCKHTVTENLWDTTYHSSTHLPPANPPPTPHLQENTVDDKIKRHCNKEPVTTND